MAKKKSGSSGGKKKKRATQKVGSEKISDMAPKNATKFEVDGIVDVQNMTPSAREVSTKPKGEEVALDNLPSFSSMAAGPVNSGKIRGTGRLGLGKRRDVPKVTPKTAADFISEGIIDEIDDETTTTVDELADVAAMDKGPSQFVAEDIRSGIDDASDPFVVEEENRT